MKCGALRVIIIDAASMMSVELLRTLEKVVSDARRPEGTYKFRGAVIRISSPFEDLRVRQ